MRVKRILKRALSTFALVLALDALSAEYVCAEEVQEQSVIDWIYQMDERERTVYETEKERIEIRSSRKDATRRRWELLSKYEYDKDGIVTEHTEYVNDEKGNCISYTYYQGEELAEYTVQYRYDEKGNCICAEYTYFDLDSERDRVEVWIQYQYNEAGDLLTYKNISYNEDDSVLTEAAREYTYNSFGECETEKAYSDGNLEYQYSYTYDANGKLVSRDYQSGYTKQVTKYYYDVNGKLIREEEYNKRTNKLLEAREYIYKGDKCVKENIYDGKTLSSYCIHAYDAAGNEIAWEFHHLQYGCEKKNYEYRLVGNEYRKVSCEYYWDTKACLHDGGSGNVDRYYEGWIEEYDANDNYIRTVNYGKNKKVQSYEYHFEEIDSENAVDGKLKKEIYELYDADETLVSGKVCTYQLYVYESDEAEEDNPENTGFNGLKPAADGTWYKYINGVVDTAYTGLYNDATYGWWLIRNGVVAFDYNGLWGDTNYGWWLISGGSVNFSYTGLYGDATYGWWLIGGGAVEFDYNGLWGDANYGWWLVNGGSVNFGYTGLYCDATYGWWLIGGGAVAFDYNGLWGDANYGWWLVNGGTVNFNYTGLYYDTYCGWWYVEGGAVGFGYTGEVYYDGVPYYVVNGQLI